MLRERHAELTPKLNRHGIHLRMDVLRDAHRHLVALPPATTRIGKATAKLHAVLDELSIATRLAPGS
jgi:hypothetical protein